MIRAVALALVLLSLAAVTGPAFADRDGPLRRTAAVTTPYWEYDVGSRIQGIAAADLDGDGQEEILAGTEKGDLRVLRADGLLLWQYAAGGPVWPIVVADLFADGQPEVLIGDGTSRLLLLRGDTPLRENLPRLMWQWSPDVGVSQEAVAIGTQAGGAVRQVAVADLTGDNSPEILVGSDDFTVYALDRSGVLLWKFSAGNGITSLSAADVDSDGVPEVLVGSLDGFAYALNAAGQPKWQFHAPEGATALATADLNNDRRTVVLIGSRGGMAYVTALTADGLGVLWDYSAGSPIQSLATGDLDGDGRSEVVIGSEVGLTVLDTEGRVLWRYPAQGYLTWARVVGTEVGSPVILMMGNAGASILRYVRQPDEMIEQAHFYGSGPRGLAIFSDVNGDGVGEVAVAAGHDVRLFGYTTQAPERGLRWTFTTGQSVSTVDFGDVDGDGLAEVVVGSFDRNVYVLREGQPVVPVLTTGGLVNTVCVSNLLGDSAKEILAGSTDGRVYAFSLAGGLLWQYTTQGEVKSLTIGLRDVIDPVPEVLAGSGDGNVYALRAHDGQVIWQFATGGPVSALATGDVTDDLLPDILVGSSSGTVYVLGARDGQIAWQFTTGGPITSLAIADLNGDGLPDLLAGSDEVYALSGHDGTVLWQDAVSPNSVVTADLDGDGRFEALVGTPDGGVYALHGDPDQSDRAIWRYQASDAIRSVTAADVDGDGLPEVLAGARDGSVYVLTGGTGETDRLMSHYLVGGAVTRLGGVDVDSDGLAEVVATSNDGKVYLYGLSLNQAPLLVNAAHEPAAAGWVYFVDVIDPEGDEAAVQLEVRDPAGPPWARGGQPQWAPHGLRNYAGEGERQLSWFVAPFDWWDRGLPTQFRLVFNDGRREGQLPVVKGPQVPGPRWQVITIPPLLAVMLLIAVLAYRVGERRRRWAESPGGQAQQLYHRIARNPEGLLTEIRHVIAKSDDAARILSELHLLYEREEGQSARTDVTQGYALMLRSPDLLEGGLHTLISGLSRLEGVEGQGEVLAVFQLLRTGLDANSVPRIVGLQSQIEAARPMVKASVLVLPGLDKVLELWLQVTGSLQGYEKVQAAEDKIRYLGRAVESLGRLERDVRRTFTEPERSLLGEITGRWLTAVNNALSEVRGRAELKMALKTRHTLAVGDISLVLEVRNEGNAPAENVMVELRPSKQYEVLEGVRTIPFLPAGWSDSAELRLRPRVEQSLRARFQVTYDDEQQKGKALPFADEVSLVRVEEAFQPIVNPYYAGRPLETGSPLFFGREDVFDFIQQNISGRFQDNVLVLIGQRRTGKTSLLKQLPVRLGEHYVPVYIDGQQLGIDPGMVNLFYSLSRIIARGLRERDIQVTQPSRADFEPAPAAVFEEEFLTEVQGALGDRRLVLSLDEFEELENRVRDGRLDNTIFPFMRHLMQHSDRLAFIFVGTHRLEQLSSDYWSIFFNIALHRDIRFLDETAARRLIVEPVREANMVYDDLAVERILDITARHPYFLQLMCHALVNFHNSSQRNYITVQDVRDVVGEIIGLGEAHFAFIWANASPGERLVLAALTRLLVEETMVTSSDVANILAEYGQKMDPNDVSAMLSGLADQDIVDEVRNHITRHRFKLDLVRLWIERFKPLSAVVEEVT